MLCFIVYTEEAHPRQSPVPGLAPVSTWNPLPFNFLRIRTSKNSLPQPLYNPHFRSPLGCVGNKGLTSPRIHRQLFCNQHLRTPLRSAGNTGVIILLESALTKNAPATPLESALTKNRGRGALLQGPLKFNPCQRTCTNMRETSSVGGPSRHAATPSRMPCFIWSEGRDEVRRTISWTPSMPSISPRELKTSVIPSVYRTTRSSGWSCTSRVVVASTSSGSAPRIMLRDSRRIGRWP